MIIIIDSYSIQWVTLVTNGFNWDKWDQTQNKPIRFIGLTNHCSNWSNWVNWFNQSNWSNWDLMREVEHYYPIPTFSTLTYRMIDWYIMKNKS